MGERDRPVVSVVDDDESLRRALRNLLRSVGFGVETFASAEEFLRSAQRENTGCLVLDLRMTGMSGLDLLRHLAVADSPIPVVILTAHGDEETRRRSLQAGAVAFLDKPFRSDVLLDAVRDALR
ncbi:MAG: two-component system response regulator [Candidatus Rokuibacteriota bacterium]|nr:MAG: two-component system response regulator [Candidatus Rokubacteria bacterium]